MSYSFQLCTDLWANNNKLAPSSSLLLYLFFQSIISFTYADFYLFAHIYSWTYKLESNKMILKSMLLPHFPTHLKIILVQYLILEWLLTNRRICAPSSARLFEETTDTRRCLHAQASPPQRHHSYIILICTFASDPVISSPSNDAEVGRESPPLHLLLATLSPTRRRASGMPLRWEDLHARS
jgi:hypothetical protein